MYPFQVQSQLWQEDKHTFPVTMGHTGSAAEPPHMHAGSGRAAFPGKPVDMRVIAYRSLSCAPAQLTPPFPSCASEGEQLQNCQKQDPGPSSLGEERRGVLRKQ